MKMLWLRGPFTVRWMKFRKYVMKMTLGNLIIESSMLLQSFFATNSRLGLHQSEYDILVQRSDITVQYPSDGPFRMTGRYGIGPQSL